MPIYEYRCKECGNEFEELILGKEENISCPKCKSSNISRLLSLCRSKVSGNEFSIGGTSSGGGCSSCSGGNCSSCG